MLKRTRVLLYSYACNVRLSSLVMLLIKTVNCCAFKTLPGFVHINKSKILGRLKNFQGHIYQEIRRLNRVVK